MSKESERQQGIDRALSGSSEPEGLSDHLAPFRSEDDRAARADGYRLGQIIGAQRRAEAEARVNEGATDRERDADEREANERERRDAQEEEAQRRADQLEELELQRQEDLDEAEERADERARQIAYKNSNPGDFECPSCFYVTLRRKASRCPECHGEVHRSYWERIEAREMEQRRQHEEQIARAEEERRKAEAAHQAWLKSPEGIAVESAKRAEAAAAIRRSAWEHGWKRNAPFLRLMVLVAFCIVGVQMIVFIVGKMPAGHREATQSFEWESTRTESPDPSGGLNRRTVSGQNPLAVAVVWHDLTWVKALLDNGADMYAIEAPGLSTTIWGSVIASTPRSYEMVKVFVEHGADVNRHLGVSHDDWAPLHFAAYTSFRISKLLVQHGAKANTRSNKGQTPLHFVAGYGASSEKAPDDRDDGRARGTDLVDLLLAAGADINAKDNHGVTPLGAAIKKQADQRNRVDPDDDRTFMINYLRSKGAKE